MEHKVTPNDPRANYDAFAAVNWSTLKHIGKSPLHYQHALAYPPTQTPAMALGQAVHVAVLEPELFARLYVMEPDFGDCRRKENKANRDQWRANHSQLICLSPADWASCLSIASAVSAHPVSGPLLKQGQAEVSLAWEREGIQCKGRVDWLRDDCIIDLKTTRDIREHGFGRQAAQLDYHSAMAWYRDGYQRITGKELPVVLIAVENSAPWDVAVFRYDEDALYYGNQNCHEYIQRLAQCRETDCWPGIYEEEQTLHLPTWMTVRDDDGDTGVVVGGVEI